MDCCQLEDYIQQKGVKREEPSNNDPENDSPDADREGEKEVIWFEENSSYSYRITPYFKIWYLLEKK